MLKHNKNIFQCKYCPQTFSRQGAYRNHLKSHRDQMYLDENNLTRDENNLTREENTSSPIAKNTFQKTIFSPILIDDDIINPHGEQTYGANVEETFFVEVKF